MADVFSIDDIMTQAMGSVLGGTPFAALQPFLQNQAYSMLGLASPGQRDALLDTVLFSNMTPYGTAQEMQRRQMHRIAADALKTQQFAARANFFSDVSKTTMSYASWKALDPANNTTETGYQNFIQSQAEGMSNNFLWSTMYNLLDPDGVMAAAENLQQAGANAMRHSRNAGRRTAYLQARAIGNLFTDEQGRYNFKSEDYGFMDVGEASAVAAALTKSRDFFSGAGNDPAELKKAAGELGKAVQKYTEALSPLKDVFGKDIPAMINAIEDLSGQRFSSMTSTRVADLAQRVIAGSTVGNYTIGQLSAMNQQVSNAIMQMGVPYINDLGALAQSETILGITQSGIAPAFMSQARFNQQTADDVLRASNSRGARMLNFAYSAWRQQEAHKDGTMEEFKKQYQQLRSTLSTDEAIRAISGQANLAMVEEIGSRAGFYREAVQQNLGGEMANMIENTQQAIDAGRYYIGTLEGRATYEKAIAAAREHPEWLNDPEQAADPDIRAELYAITSGQRGDELSRRLLEEANYKRYAPARDKQIRMQQRSREVKSWMAASLGGAIRKFIGGQGFKDITAANFEDKVLADEDRELLAGAYNRASYMADMEGYTEETKEGKEARAKFMEDQIFWEWNNGITNTLYTDLSIKYDQAQTAQEKAELAGRMHLVRNVDQGILARYLGDENAEGYNERFSELVNRFQLATTEGGFGSSGVEARDFMRSEMVKEALLKDSRFQTKEYQGRLERLSDAITAEAAKEGALEQSKIKELAEKAGFEREDLDRIQIAARDVYGTQDQSTQITNLFGAITELIQKLSPLVDELAKKNQNETTAPEKQ